MANTLLTIGMITKETLRLFRNSNSFLKTINTEYSDQFAKEGAKIGASLNIRKPVDYTVRSGPTASYQNTTETYTTLTIGNQLGVDMSFTSVDMALSIDKFASRYIKPAVNNLAGKVAASVMSMVEGGSGQGPVSNFVHNVSGSATTTPTASTWLQAGAILDANSAPRGDGMRVAMIDNLSNARTVSGLSGFFNPQVRIGEQLTTGMMNKDFLGLDWYTDQTIIKHTTGTFSAGAINGANQTGSTLTVGAITGTLTAGDIITVAGVNQVNRVTKVSTETPMQFVVTSAVASGATSIPIYPALIPAGAGGVQTQYQTVDVSPANSAAISLVNAASEVYRKNLVYVPEAFTLATVDLPFISKGVVDCARENYDGISLRMITTYDPINDILATRLDILFGYALLRPEWVVAVADAV